MDVAEERYLYGPPPPLGHPRVHLPLSVILRHTSPLGYPQRNHFSYWSSSGASPPIGHPRAHAVSLFFLVILGRTPVRTGDPQTSAPAHNHLKPSPSPLHLSTFKPSSLAHTSTSFFGHPRGVTSVTAHRGSTNQCASTQSFKTVTLVPAPINL